MPQPALPGQQTLFTMRRNWAPLLAVDRRRQTLPALTPAARQLADDFNRLMIHQQWDSAIRHLCRRTLLILLSWLGADAPILEADVRDLARSDSAVSAKRVCAFLADRNLLTPDPRRHDRHQTGTDRLITAWPTPLNTQLHSWATTVRERNQPPSWRTIRNYLRHLQPALTTWTGQNITSLQQVTPPHIERALADHPHSRTMLLAALRSLFTTLKRQQLITHDPTHGHTTQPTLHPPRPLPADRLHSLLHHAPTAFGRLTLALIAIHALQPLQVTRLRTNDLDLTHATLTVHRGPHRQPHTLYLEDLTHRLATQWITERHHRWPHSTNPHLLISTQSATDPTHPAVHVATLNLALTNLDLPLHHLRQDRILDEATTTQDPLRLTSLFGIHPQTAMRYTHAARPDPTHQLE
ncbi:hypothetical protein ACFVGN_18675 [Streptomyces sp. NPDC057757]|uniref:hypothetical protein n=1 Tax=Streptomyces sp. NPDC057757 TaxID=3346241 RepID=UPI0036890925